MPLLERGEPGGESSVSALRGLPPAAQACACRTCEGERRAEREGFEPPEPFRVQWFSRPPPSTTRPSLRVLKLYWPVPSTVSPRTLAGVALLSGSLLMTELSLTRIFSVTMYYHFAFMAISIALFGLSASGVYVFLLRDRWKDVPTERLLAVHAFAYAAVTVVALTVLVKLRVGLTYTPSNIALMSLMYVLSALPFFAGGAAISLAISRLTANVNAVYAVDLLGAGVGCLLLMPALNVLGAPGAIVTSALLGIGAAVCFAPLAARAAIAGACRRTHGRGARRVGRRRVRGQHDQRAREPPGPVQQVELVLAHRRLRAAATGRGR